MIAARISDGAVAAADYPDPQPGKGEVVVGVRAAGLNGADMHQLAGRYPAPPGSPPDIPGLELAGEVVAVGADAMRFELGARVMGIVGGGAQAELTAVHERQLMAVPDSVDWPAAGGFPECFTTAQDALFSQCELGPGERLLINGGAGGVGSAAIQLGALAGASVFATVRDANLRDAVADLGATALAPDEFADHGPFDVILELVGAPNLPGDLQALAPLGRIAVIGTGAGSHAELDLSVLMARRARIHGSTLRSRALEDKAAAARAVERHVLPALAAGKLRVPIAATFPLADVAGAYERFAAGSKLGKVVLVIG
ncbi:MAG: zinc-binding dehydrogenase [Solirubrobacteraceae bacterium]|jgi:NADPH:quinone reductase-like Zn-dependent oxidoreductase